MSNNRVITREAGTKVYTLQNAPSILLKFFYLKDAHNASDMHIELHYETRFVEHLKLISFWGRKEHMSSLGSKDGLNRSFPIWANLPLSIWSSYNIHSNQTTFILNCFITN